MRYATQREILCEHQAVVVWVIWFVNYEHFLEPRFLYTREIYSESLRVVP
jgi:hypothetical protein